MIGADLARVGLTASEKSERKRDGKQLFTRNRRAVSYIKPHDIIDVGEGNTAFVAPLHDALTHLQKHVTSHYLHQLERNAEGLFSLLDSVRSFTTSHYKRLKEEVRYVPTLIERYGADAHVAIQWLAKGLKKLLIDLLVPIKEAAVHAAHEFGAFAKQQHSSVTLELSFYLFTFFQEPNTVPLVDNEAYLKSNGKELADYLEAIAEDKVAPSSTPWLVDALKDNHYVVIETFTAIKAELNMSLLSRFNELSYMFHNQFKGVDIGRDPLGELREVAAAAASGVDVLDSYDLSSGFVGTVDPWLVASVMRQLYCNQDIDEQTCNLIAKQRFGKSANELLRDISAIVGALQGDLWMNMVETYNNPDSTQADIDSSINNYVNISARAKKGWFSGWGEEEEKEETEDDKGKEEETPAQAKLRRKAERRKQAIESYMAEFQMDPAMQNLRTPADVSNAIFNLNARIEAEKIRIANRRAELGRVVSSAQDAADRVVGAAKSSAIEYRASPARHGNRTKLIAEETNQIEKLSNDYELVAVARKEEIEDELKKLEHWKAFLEGDLRSRTAQINTRGRNIGTFIMLIGGILVLLFWLYRFNEDLFSENNLILKQLDSAAIQTGTKPFLNMLKTKWYDSTPYYLGSIVRDAPVPAVLERIASESAASMTNFRVHFTAGYEVGVAAFYNFINPYTVAAQGLLDETAAFITVQTQQRGVPLTDPIIEANQYFLQNIRAALEAVQRVTDATSAVDPAAVTEAFMRARSADMMRAVALLQDVMSAANVKMLTGKAPEVISRVARSYNNLFGLVPVVAGIGNMAWRYTFGSGPGAADLTMAGLHRAAATAHGEVWGRALVALGNAQITLAVIPPAMVMMTAYSIGNMMAAIQMSYSNPVLIVTEHSIGLTLALKKMLELITTDVLASSAAQMELRWDMIFKLAHFAVLFLPMLQVGTWAHKGLSAIANWHAQRKARMEAEANRVRLEGSNAFVLEPPPTREQQPAIRMIEPSTEAVVSMFTQRASESRELVPVVVTPPTTTSARRPPLRIFQNPRRRNRSPSPSPPDIKCSICDDIALVKCTHCKDKQYCGRECARKDREHMKK